MAVEKNNVRDLREAKNLSVMAVADESGLGWAAVTRIERNSPRTTQEEVDACIAAIEALPPGERKLSTGRPFKDEKKAEAIKAARETGASVSAIVTADSGDAPEPAAKPKPKPKPAAKKSTPKKAKPAASKKAKPAAKKSASSSRSRSSSSRSRSRSRGRS